MQEQSQEMTITEVSGLAERIQMAVSQVICGAEQTIRQMTIAILCGGHILLEDLPGRGKTTLVKAFAKALGCADKRVQGTPDLMPADLTGFEILAQQPNGSRKMVFRKGPVFTNLLLADEINRMTPRAQAGLLECMAEHQVSAGGKIYALPKPFFVIATQNPIELQGTFPLPEAQLDRFFMRLQMGQPPREQEMEILRDRQTADPLEAVTAVTSPEQLCMAQIAVRGISASDAVLQYILDLAEGTRKHAQVRYGISTRGALALRHAAQGAAALAGRDYLLPDDVKAVFPAVCTHRIQANSGLLSDEKDAAEIIQDVLEHTAVEKP